MPKEKTFWVKQGFVCVLVAKTKKDVANQDDYILNSTGKLLFGKMKRGELKQFKIVEVKRERP